MSEDIYKLIGESIKHRRKEKGMTQQELAEKVELSTNYVGLIERGDRHAGLDILQKIADVFGIGLKGLFEKTAVRPSGKSDYTFADKRILSLLRETSPAEKKAFITLISSRSRKKH